ncbi:MAG: hypothetical protein JW768_02575 [Chitinispirillaceae bacterium]|nr:hypothetical protein [Chitinispirillaceae bacterium]
MKRFVMILATLPLCMMAACMFFPGHRQMSVVVRLDGVEVTCTMPEKGYTVSERQQTDDNATVTYECPVVLTQGGYSVIPLFSIYIEKAEATLSRVKFNNRARALFEARTVDVMDEKNGLLGREFIETLQERRYGLLKSRIYQATTTRGKYGIRIAFQVPGEVFDQAFGQIRLVIRSVQISAPVK